MTAAEPTPLTPERLEEIELIIHNEVGGYAPFIATAARKIAALKSTPRAVELGAVDRNALAKFYIEFEGLTELQTESYQERAYAVAMRFAKALLSSGVIPVAPSPVVGLTEAERNRLVKSRGAWGPYSEVGELLAIINRLTKVQSPKEDVTP